MARWGGYALSCVLLGILFIAPPITRPSQADPVETPEVAVIQDGPSPLLDALAHDIEIEAQHLLGEERPITFRRFPVAPAWNRESIAETIRTVESDPNVGVILGIGILVSQVAEKPDFPLSKPMVVSYLQRSEVPSLPITKDGYSAKKNYIFSVLNLPITRDIKTFRELTPFHTLSVLLDDKILGKLPDLEERVHEIETTQNIKIRLVPATATAQGTLKQLGQAEAVLITPLLQMDADEVGTLIKGINARGIPSFSSYGYPDVEKGALAGLLPKPLLQTARQAALNLQQAIQGKPLDSIPVLMPVEAALLVNAQTAHRVRFNPDLAILGSIKFLNGDTVRRGEKITLDEALKMGEQRNIDLTIQEAAVAITKQNSLISRSPLLPQAKASVGYTIVDRELAEASLGVIPQRSADFNIGLSQVIFNDEFLSRFRSSKRDVSRSEYRYDSIRLDTMQQAGKRFAEVLSAQSLLRIAWENLDLTLNQLEITRLRYELGSGGRDAVYRWEVQENQQRAAVYSRYAELQQAITRFNQSINVDQLKEWNPQTLNFDTVRTYFMGGYLGRIIKKAKQLRSFRVFVVEEALKNSPELKEIAMQAEAEGIMLGQRKRQFIVPDLNTNFQYTRQLQADRVSSSLGLVDTTDDAWRFNVNLELPLLEGGRRFHEVGQSKALIKRIESERIRTEQILERNALNALYAVESSALSLEFFKEAAEKAKLNFDIVQLKYTQGITGIIDMLDAQNEYIRRSEQASLAIYSHLINLIDLQRAIGWFEVDKNVQQKEDWRQAVARFYQ